MPKVHKRWRGWLSGSYLLTTWWHNYLDRVKEQGRATATSAKNTHIQTTKIRTHRTCMR